MTIRPNNKPVHATPGRAVHVRAEYKQTVIDRGRVTRSLVPTPRMPEVPNARPTQPRKRDPRITHAVSSTWRKFDEIAALKTTLAAKEYERGIRDTCDLFPEQRDALLAAVRRKHLALERAEKQIPEPQVIFLGPNSFEGLIERLARKNLSDGVHFGDAEYLQLPKPLQRLVDARVQRCTLAYPSGHLFDELQQDPRQAWARGAFSTWRRDGVEIVSDKVAQYRGYPNPRVGLNNLTLGLTPDELDQLERLQRGRASVPTEAPAFLPQPAWSAEVLELAAGIIHRRPEEVLSKFHVWGREPLFRGVREQRERLSPAERHEALPWLLLSLMARKYGRGRTVQFERLKGALYGDEKALIGLYVGCAPDERPEMNGARKLHQGELENRAVRALRKYAPELLPLVRAGPRPTVRAVEQLIDATPGQPMSHVNVIADLHLLDDNILGALVRLGLKPERAHVTSPSYSASEPVAEREKAEGFDVETSARTDLPYQLWRPVVIGALIRKGLEDHKLNGLPVVAFQDGGFITEAVHRYFPDDASVFTLVEQTKHGDRVTEAQHLKTDVISIAQEEAKRFELPGVCRSMREQIPQRLDLFMSPSFFPGRFAVVNGFGWIGQVAADTIKDQRRILVVDPDPNARDAAREHGYDAVATLAEALPRAAIILMASGEHQWTDEEKALLEPGQVVISLSSSDRESPYRDQSRVHEDVLVDGVLVLGGGFPLNFTGSGKINDPNELQYTRAALVSAGIQATELAARRRPSRERDGRALRLDPQRAADIVSRASVDHEA